MLTPQTTPDGWDVTCAAVSGGDSVIVGPPATAGEEATAAATSGPTAAPPAFLVLGVRIHNVTRCQAIELIDETILRYSRHPESYRRHPERSEGSSIFIVNAHTLNLAAADPSYSEVLNAADYVFADGTGIRWAARLQKVRLLDNMVGTDFVPLLFQETAGRGYSYYMLGADAQTIAVAADYARRHFPGWIQAGHHHGYVNEDIKRRPVVAPRCATAGRGFTTDLEEAVISDINAARPDLLLVGMGNPLQERWIHAHLPRLNVPVCMGVGGLFDYWAGNVSRSPQWLRRLGHEWLWRLCQQPRLKARRYLIGNPLFLARVLRQRLGL